MKSRNTPNPARTVATALVGASLAATAFGITLTPNVLGTPDDGMICRSGYAGALSGSAFKCSKLRTITVALECTKSNFPTYVTRAAGSAGTPQGRDICTRNGVNVTSTESVVNLVQGQDYVLAAVNNDTVTTRTSNADADEASALGLEAKDVDTVAADPVIQFDGGVGSKDNASVQLTHYTFAIKTGGVLSAQR